VMLHSKVRTYLFIVVRICRAISATEWSKVEEGR
jgi:hypothetical protein